MLIDRVKRLARYPNDSRQRTGGNDADRLMQAAGEIGSAILIKAHKSDTGLETRQGGVGHGKRRQI